MRPLIKRSRFLIHLDSERSASQFTLQPYGHDLEKFQEFLAPKLRQGYLPGDVTRDHILQRGENLRVIQVLMNHKSLATTARYLHTRRDELVSAVNGLQFVDG